MIGNRDRIVVMQPYFFPYAGYYRLFHGSDLFVIYDCVQFPRRGWVHRNKLKNTLGTDEWLTLPLMKAPQSVLIKDLRFPPDASVEMIRRLAPFLLTSTDPHWRAEVLRVVLDMKEDVTDYIVTTLEFAARYLGLPWSVVRSSSLNVPDSFRGQDRIIEIVRRVGGRSYLNSPGGTELYDARSFSEAGLELDFLPPHAGPYTSMLSRILAEDRDALVREIVSP